MKQRCLCAVHVAIIFSRALLTIIVLGHVSLHKHLIAQPYSANSNWRRNANNIAIRENTVSIYTSHNLHINWCSVTSMGVGQCN